MALDWSFLQSFTAVLEHGSLSAASRETGISQPTLSRHITGLEQQLGVRVFERGRSGVTPTEAGARLAEDAKLMGDAAVRMSMLADGVDEGVSGTVRITASHTVAVYVLPPILAQLKLAEPNITVELAASDQSHNLLRREADIAVRMYRPEQLDVITRKITEYPLAMFAAHSYVERRGLPTTLEQLLDHDILGYDRDDRLIAGLADVGIHVTRDFFACRMDDQIAYWECVAAGMGLGLTQQQIGLADPRVQMVESPTPMPVLEVWLTAHAELHQNRRVRRVYDFLAEKLAEAGA